MKEFAWNRIRFFAPASWVPCEVGPRYLKLEDEAGPVFEARWDPVKGAFSSRAVFSRIKKSQGRALDRDTLPGGWEKAVAGFSAWGFSWSRQDAQGRGVLLFCRECKNAVLIQFLGRAAQDPDLCGRVLETFSDHGHGGVVPWALFDIRASVPERFSLRRHAFFPGQFELGFSAPGEELALHRFGPASVILSGQDLASWVGKFLPLPASAVLVPGREGHAQWEAVRHRGGLWRGLRRGPAEWKRRAWVVREKNKILCVTCSASRAMDPDLLDKVCEAYGVV